MNPFRASLIVMTFLSFVGFIARAQPEEKSAAPLKAIAVLHPIGGGSKVSGTVTFTEVADGVQVHAEITGLTPGNHRMPRLTQPSGMWATWEMWRRTLPARQNWSMWTTKSR